MTDTDAITFLARKCAKSNLNLRDARALFDALYIADAIMLEGGRHDRAADRAGVRRETMSRKTRAAIVDLQRDLAA